MGRCPISARPKRRNEKDTGKKEAIPFEPKKAAMKLFSRVNNSGRGGSIIDTRERESWHVVEDSSYRARRKTLFCFFHPRCLQHDVLSE